MKRAVLISALTCACLDGCSPADPMPHVRKSHEPLVNKAVDIYREGKVSRGDVLRDHEPVVVYLPDMTCVGLNLKEHMVLDPDLWGVGLVFLGLASVISFRYWRRSHP